MKSGHHHRFFSAGNVDTSDRHST